MRVYILRVDDEFQGEEIVFLDETNVADTVKDRLPNLDNGDVLVIFPSNVTQEQLEAFMEIGDEPT